MLDSDPIYTSLDVTMRVYVNGVYFQKQCIHSFALTPNYIKNKTEKNYRNNNDKK